MKKQWLCRIMIICLLVSMLPYMGAQADSYTITVPSGSLSTKLNFLKTYFKHGWYWNNWSDSDLGTGYQQNTITVNGHKTTISTKPCMTHNSTTVRSSCNKAFWVSRAGWQCCGYARMIFNLALGLDLLKDAYQMKYCSVGQDTSFVDNLKAGDVIHTGSHYRFVTAVNGNNVTYTDCNSDSQCIIKWDQSISKATLKSYMKSKGGEIYSASPIIIDDTTNAWRAYKIVSSTRNILRNNDPSITKVVTKVQKDEVIYVDENRQFTDSDGTWGYCKTSAGEYGWIIIKNKNGNEIYCKPTTDGTYTVPSGSASEKLAYLQGIFTEGKYWNKWSASALGSNTQQNITINGHATTISSKPCNHSSTSTSGCNEYWGAWKGKKGLGYARMIFNLVWNVDPENGSAYTLYYNENTKDACCLDYVKVGDMIQTSSSHNMVVTAVSGDTFTVTECNKGNKCDIHWGTTYTKAALKAEMASANSGRVYSASSFKMNSTHADWQSYQIVKQPTDSMGVYCQPYTDVTKVATLAKDEIVYVDKNHTRTINSATWGYCKTIGGAYGWMKISDTSECVQVEDTGEVTVIDNIPRIAVSTKVMTGDADTDQCYIKTGPYEAETTVHVEDKDTVIYLTGAVKNRYGNTWYVTEEGYYVFADDIDIKVPNATNQSDTEFEAIGIASTDKCVVKERPYGASVQVDKLEMGTATDIVGKVINNYGNTWYRRADGTYVSGDDVQIFEKYTYFCNVKGKFEWKAAENRHQLPYANAPIKGTIAANVGMTVDCIVLNAYGNLWAQLEDGTFACLYDKSTDTEKAEFTSFKETPPALMSSMKTPSGTLAQGEAFDISGSVYGRNGTPIFGAMVYIVKPDGIMAQGTDYITWDLNSSFDLVKDMKVDEVFDLAALPAGEYTFVVRVVMGFRYNSRIFLFGKGFVYLINETFNVAEAKVPVTDIFIDDIYAIDMYQACTFTCEVYPENATDKSVTWKSLNEEIITVAENGEVLSYQGPGTATIVVTANDGSGVSASIDVPIHLISLDDYYSYTPMHANFKWLENQAVYMMPNGTTMTYKDRTVKKGQVVGISEIALEFTGDLWAKLDTGGFVLFYDYDKKRELAELDSFQNNPFVTFSNVYMPSGTLTQDEQVKVGATITGVKKTPIHSIRLGVFNGSHECFGTGTLTFSDLTYETTKVIDNGYTTLSPGEHTAQIWVYMGFVYEYAGAVHEFCYDSPCGELESEFTIVEPPQYVSVESIQVTNAVDTLTYGQAYTFACAVKPDNATDKSVTWKSLNENVIVVSADGQVSYRGTGTATVRVTASDGSGVYAETTVTVKPQKVNVESIQVTNAVDTLTYGQAYTFACAVKPDNATDKSVTWKSSNEDVISVASDGNVSYHGTGTATVTVTANDGSGVSASFTVTVKPKPTLNVTMSGQKDVPGKPGEEVTFRVSMNNPDNAVLGMITLKFTMPDGVTLKKVQPTGIASNATLLIEGNPSIMVSVAENGISGSGNVAEITVALSDAVELPVEIPMSAIVVTLESEEEFRLKSFSASIKKAIVRVPGDVNGDGNVTYSDLLRLAKYLAQWDGIGINASNSDVNGDGTVSYADLLRLAKYLANWDITLK